MQNPHMESFREPLTSPDQIFAGLVVPRPGNIPAVIVKTIIHSTVYYYYEGTADDICFSETKHGFFTYFRNAEGVFPVSSYSLTPEIKPALNTTV